MISDQCHSGELDHNSVLIMYFDNPQVYSLVLCIEFKVFRVTISINKAEASQALGPQIRAHTSPGTGVTEDT